MDSLTIDIIFEMENMKCALMQFTEKVSLIFVYKIHWLIVFHPKDRVSYQMQLVSGPNKAF